MSGNKPNIIFISAEQQRGDTVHYTGADFMITPNIDRLAAESVVFGRAFSCASTCIASRAAFYTQHRDVLLLPVLWSTALVESTDRRGLSLHEYRKNTPTPYGL